MHEAQIWLVLEYCSIGSVNDLMRITNPHWLDEWEIATICRFTLHGLQYMHENRQIHRDISACARACHRCARRLTPLCAETDNILVNERGEVKLADFGVTGQLKADETKKNTIAGTPYFIAPEVRSHVRTCVRVPPLNAMRARFCKATARATTPRPTSGVSASAASKWPSACPRTTKF